MPKKTSKEPDPTETPVPPPSQPPKSPPPSEPSGGGNEDTRTQEQKRADRRYNAERQAAFEKLLEQGATPETLAASGFRPEKGGGQFHFSNLGLASEFGPVGMYSGLKIDILNKMMGEPDGKGGVNWRPMTPSEYQSIINYQNWKSGQEDKGGGFATAYDNPSYLGGTGAFQGYLRSQRLASDVKAGHLTIDPKSGWYYNVGMNDPKRPETWEWYDRNGKRVQGPPTGFTVTPTAAPAPNPYPYDTAPWKDTPGPSAFSLGLTGTTTTTTTPTSTAVTKPAEKTSIPGTEKAVPDTSTVSTPLPTWSSLTGQEKKPKTFSALTGPLY